MNDVLIRLLGARARNLDRRVLPTDAFLGPGEAHSLLYSAELKFAMEGISDLEGHRIYGMTLHVVAEPGVAVA